MNDYTPADRTKFVQVTVLNGALTGTIAHYLGVTPKCGAPNPNVFDGARAIVTADNSLVTVTTDVPVSQNIIYTIPVKV